jgi:ubiquinone/menaquinone biosynthesis C-methylase UbiE
MSLEKKKIIEFYTVNYDEDNRLVRHRIEFIATTYILNKYINEGSLVLDLGAGTGIYSIYYADRGCTVTAVDIVPRHVDTLKKKLKAFPSLAVTALVGDAEDLSRFKDNSFDVVLCMGPLYNLKDTGRCVAESLRVLKSHRILAASYGKKNETFEPDIRYKDLFIGRTPEEVNRLFQGHRIEFIANVPVDGAPFTELGKIINDYPEEPGKAYSWLQTHEAVFEKLDGLFLHGLYIGRKL